MGEENHNVCKICDYAIRNEECPFCGFSYEGFSTIEHDKQIRADAIEELKQKIVGHLSDYALQEAPMYQDDLANQKPIYDAINSCIEGVIEVAEQLKEQNK